MALPTRTNGGSVRSSEHPLERFFSTDFTRFDPFAELSNVRSTMNSLLDSVMRPSGSQIEGSWAPAVDVYEKDGVYKVEFAIPGLKKDKIDIEVADNRLTISGSFEETKSDEGEGKYLYREVRRGGFSRTIAFPSDIDADRVSATYDNGMLSLNVPLVKTLQAKKVAIKG